MSDALDVDEAVFDLVERIPPGRVSTYGAIGRLLGVGPRRVARALSSGGGAVPWWRVLRADGSAAQPLAERALAHWREEGVALRRLAADPADVRVDLARARWDLAGWRAPWEHPGREGS